VTSRQAQLAVGIGLVVALVACTDRGGQSASPAPSSSAAARTERSDEVLAEHLSPDEPGCSAAVGIEGEVAWAGARGTGDLDSGRALDETTTFDIASVSKQFTATAVLLLAQDGRLTLDDPLADWVPGLPEWSHDVTLGQLVHHRTGIPDYTSLLLNAGFDLTDPATQQDALAALAERPVTDYLPGTRFTYSNSNYVLLAEVVHRASGQPLPDFARDRIFEPLGLEMAIDPSGADPDKSDASSARPYVRDPVTEEWQPGGSRWAQVGDGSIRTTPSELVRWADNYRTGEVGGDELLEAQLIGPAGTSAEGYAAGIVVRSDGGLWHNGSWAGFLTTFSVSPDRRLAVAVSCNGDAGPSSPIEDVAADLRSVWDG
jgi:CubicO group peptidase (beta-lactamase class C family)